MAPSRDTASRRQRSILWVDEPDKPHAWRIACILGGIASVQCPFISHSFNITTRTSGKSGKRAQGLGGALSALCNNAFPSQYPWAQTPYGSCP